MPEIEVPVVVGPLLSGPTPGGQRCVTLRVQFSRMIENHMAAVSLNYSRLSSRA
jgi:hypothetical protein